VEESRKGDLVRGGRGDSVWAKSEEEWGKKSQKKVVRCENDVSTGATATIGGEEKGTCFTALKQGAQKEGKRLIQKGE